MNINKIWEEQENDPSFSSGLLLRRVDISCLPDISIGLLSENRQRCLCLVMTSIQPVDISLYNKLQDVSFRLVPHKSEKEKQSLLITLNNPLHNEVFSVLCQDLISAVSELAEETSVLNTLFSRFTNWNTLFTKSNGDRLSTEQQRGLFGELFFLRILLEKSSDFMDCISCWTGPESGVRDFQKNGWAVEVKTSKGNRHQKIHINGERQLDERLLENLFLFHLSLEVLRLHGETLAEMVDSIQQILCTNLQAINRFQLSLLLAGYRTEDEEHYISLGYQVRESNFYRIEGNFPRIREGDLSAAIGDVEYSILLADCITFRKEPEEVLGIIIPKYE